MKAKKALAKSQGLILLSGGQDSNLRPLGPKPSALPTALLPYDLNKDNKKTSRRSFKRRS